MYPFLRFAKELWLNRKAPPLVPGAVHHARLICWPWDLDGFMELNNGRALSLMDLGRLVMLQRTVSFARLRARGWTVAIAGASVRYRRRITVFDRLEVRSRIVGWDARFLYVENGIWRRGECAVHGLFRLAVARPEGIVPPAEVCAAFGFDPVSPPLPDWVAAWAGADAMRPWPPMADAP